MWNLQTRRLLYLQNLHCKPQTHPLHAHQIITNPWPLPMPYNCALFLGSLLFLSLQLLTILITLISVPISPKSRGCKIIQNLASIPETGLLFPQPCFCQPIPATKAITKTAWKGNRAKIWKKHLWIILGVSFYSNPIFTSSVVGAALHWMVIQPFTHSTGKVFICSNFASTFMPWY